MAMLFITLRRLFGNPPVLPAPAIGPVTAAIRAMREADLSNRIELLGREIEATSSDDRALAHLSTLRHLIAESAAMGGARRCPKSLRQILFHARGSVRN